MAKKLKIASRAGTFRRAGFEFGPEPRVLDVEGLSETKIKALLNEPQLVVVEVNDTPTFTKAEIEEIKKKAAADKEAEINAKATKTKADVAPNGPGTPASDKPKA